MMNVIMKLLPFLFDNFCINKNKPTFDSVKNNFGLRQGKLELARTI